jgi:hypothetical protein
MKKSFLIPIIAVAVMALVPVLLRARNQEKVPAARGR